VVVLSLHRLFNVNLDQLCNGFLVRAVNDRAYKDYPKEFLGVKQQAPANSFTPAGAA